ncbi:CDP-glucose 4,6-dehydratase [Paenibacillus albidus]|nr:CDP-glucose 4,6-dehydratase [Paenibacillus albidus]
MLSSEFWKGKKVMITGHTGFKGSWLCLWLHALGAEVTGYGLEPKSTPNLFTVAGVGELCRSVIADIRDQGTLLQTLLEAQPEVIIHMAAQPLVRYSYQNPAETYEVNVMGTVYLLDAVRIAAAQDVHVRALLNVTTDKCYENQEWDWGYREDDQLGGYDPYSNSKACSELVTASYRSSYFNPDDYLSHGLCVATARAGNVIGGGDWSEDRIIPDCMRALHSGNKLLIRNPSATRPWQHVLEPLCGYLLLTQSMVQHGVEFSAAWNFGPSDENERDVEWLVWKIAELWGKDDFYELHSGPKPHEATNLRLDSSKARRKLGWFPKWNVERGLKHTIQWYQAYQRQDDMRRLCLEQLNAYTSNEI